jgi:anti-sigma B factor antagonist
MPLDETLTVTVVVEETASSVFVSGEVDVFSVPQLSSAISREIDAGKRRIVVDLSGVTFIDAFSLDVLVALTVAANAAGSDLSLRNPSSQFIRVRQLVDSGRVLHVEA